MQKTNIKVVHIATYNSYGAGIAARRIHEALLNSGVDSYFLVQDDFTQKNKARNVFTRVLNKVKKVSGKFMDAGSINRREYLQHQLEVVQSNLKCEIASLPFSMYDIKSHPLVQDADIIHLHWVADLLDYPGFFKDNYKPIVWTCHDMNPIKGLYHYEGDEKRNAPLTAKLDKKIYKIKRNALQQNKGAMAVVAPSKWLYNEIKESPIFNSVPSYIIPYPINSQVFAPGKNSELKKELKIPEDHTVFLFVAQSVDNYRKGFDLLATALYKLDSTALTLLVIGQAMPELLSGLNCIYLGGIYDNHLLSSYYSLADAYILPSREDNLPNVMLESLVCGTPVLAFDVGGMKDAIVNNVNGLKATHVDAGSLQLVLQSFIKNKALFNREKIRLEAVGIYSAQKVASSYLDVYNSLIS